MKFISSLPKVFKFGEQKENGLYLFQENKLQNVTVLSPEFHIYDKSWCVLINEKFQKSDNTKFPIGLQFKLFEIDLSNNQFPKAKIDREIIKGRFASTNLATYYSAAFSLKEMHWILYSVYAL
jgi:hypothetical protein